MGDTFVDEEDEDQDSLKEALLETSPYLLAITILVSILHSVFELLAFKNGKYKYLMSHFKTMKKNFSDKFNWKPFGEPLFMTPFYNTLTLGGPDPSFCRVPRV